MDTKKETIIYFRESLIQSVLSDIFTFGLLFSLPVINRLYLGDKWYFDILAIIIFFMMSASRANTRCKRFTSMDELKKFITTSEKGQV